MEHGTSVWVHTRDTSPIPKGNKCHGANTRRMKKQKVLDSHRHMLLVAIRLSEKLTKIYYSAEWYSSAILHSQTRKLLREYVISWPHRVRSRRKMCA